MKCQMVVLAALASLTGGVSAKDRFEPVREFIAEQMTQGGVTGVSVALSQHGKIVWEQGFGWADKEQRIPATEHTLFSLASISKPITATGLMTLVQAGKVSLDQPVNDYLDNVRLVARVGDARTATVRAVANHSSGLPTYYHLIFSDEAFRQASFDETLAHYGNLVWAPGERFEYSNLGYGVLDHVITRVSGKSFADFMSAEVFAPLGLTHMSVDIGARQAGNVAVRYTEDGEPLPFYGSDHPGASAVYGSAHDLIRFAMFHLKDHLQDQRPILPDDAIDAMQRITFRENATSAYGVAWNLVDRPGGYRTVEHGGGMPGVGVVLLLLPEQDIAVAVLTNHRQGRHRAIADQALRVLLPQWQPKPKQERGPDVALAPPLELQGKWQGVLHTYRSDTPLTLEVLPSGDVHAGLRGQHLSVVKHARYHDGMFEGSIAAQLDTPEVVRWGPTSIDLVLKLRGTVLNGGALAWAENPRSGTVGYWVELRKQ